MDEKPKRPRSNNRREQILNETINLIMQSGLSGATMIRIAEKVGISQPAIYRHFKNRKEIMLASVNAAFLQLAEGINFEEKDAAAYLRKMSMLVYKEFTRNPGSSRVLFEFICAPPDEELREPVVKYLLMFLKLIEYRLSEGVDQGVFRDDLDLELTTWEGFSLGFTLSFVSLLGLQEMLSEEKAGNAIENMVDRIIAKKKVKPLRRKPASSLRRRVSPKS